MKAKSQCFPLLNRIIAQLEQQHALTVKVIHGDDEVKTKKMRMWASEDGVWM